MKISNVSLQYNSYI